MRLPWIWLALTGCIVVPPAAPPQPPVAPTMTCHLAPAVDARLTWPAANFAQLLCTAVNTEPLEREVCGVPYVGVRETGAIHAPHDEVCSDSLVKGASETFYVKLDFPRQACDRVDDDRGGCVIEVLRGTPAEVVEFARQLQGQAPEAGRDQPTARECDALFASWRAARPRYLETMAQMHDRDEPVARCMMMPRAVFACLRSAADDRQARACAPR